MNTGRLLLLIAGLFCGCGAGAWAEPAGTTDVWLDVDAANGVGEVDDGLMMIQVFHSPELKVHGVSTVYGNTDLDRALPIARDIVARFGPADLPVYGGAASSSDFGTENEATRALAAALARQPLTILAVGPVTNIGTLVRLHPELHRRIQRIVMVAARRPHQRFFVSPRTLTDFNFEHDPEAMQAILDTPIPLTFAPWEVSSKVWITRDDLANLAATGPSGQWLADTCADWIQRWEERIGPWGFNPFDALAAGWLTHPDLIETIRVTAGIEVDRDDAAPPEERAAGKTKPYLHVVPAPDGEREILYAFRPDPRFKGVLLRRLASPAHEAIPNADRLARTAGAFDHAIFDALLHKHVDDHGMVDYAALRSDERELDEYIAALDSAEVQRLGRDEQLALLINAYNAFTLKLIVEHYPLASIKDIPKSQRWKARRWRLAGHTLSLDDLEHDWIRPQFGEPRIHFALVCAAKSCPPLRREAYRGSRLDEQLADQTRYVHTHDRWLQFRPGARELRLTSLYKWYGGDFQPEAASVADYAARCVPELEAALRAGLKPQVVWLPYDWSLNARGD